jgi:phage terminase large subunit
MKYDDRDISVTHVFLENKKAYERHEHRVISNQGSTRSSKTYSLCQLLPVIAMSEKKSISILSPSLPHLKRGARRDFLEIMQRWRLYSDKYFNKTDNIFEFPKTGSYIEFFGIEDEGKVHGTSRDILYINEANLITRNIYTQLAIRTNDVIFLDFNPADEFSWVYDVSDMEGNKLIISTYRNNVANLSREIVQEIESLKDADENLWKVYGLGLRGTSSETIYTHWRQIDYFPGECDETFYGLDFGFNNPSVLVKVGIKDRKLYAEEIFYESKLTTNDLIDAIKIYGITKRSEIFCDAAEPKTIEEIRRAGLNALPAEKSVYDGIQKVKSYPLYITRSSVNMTKEIKSYKWKLNKEQKPTDEPVKFFDHAMDALRYAVFTKLNKPRRELVYVI